MKQPFRFSLRSSAFEGSRRSRTVSRDQALLSLKALDWILPFGHGLRPYYESAFMS
jgi:hypothetical protein